MYDCSPTDNNNAVLTPSRGTTRPEKLAAQDAISTPVSRRTSTDVGSSGRNDPRSSHYPTTSTHYPMAEDNVSSRPSPNARHARSKQRQGRRSSDTPRTESGAVRVQSHSNSPEVDGSAAGTARIFVARPDDQSEGVMSPGSSMSSFTSDIDNRFNPQGGATGLSKDPIMIQAITETMIGEFMWKYKRRPMHRSEISNSRHRRYVWVHPYTRTIYWSSREPQSGVSNNWVKSLPIEGIRVIEDTNPYPPGLSQQSIDIITPSRTMRFTAMTTQRHDVWYNAITYLLVKTANGGAVRDSSDAGRDYFLDISSSIAGSTGPRSSRISSQSHTMRHNGLASSPAQGSSRRLHSNRRTPSNLQGNLSPLSVPSTSRTSRPRSISRIGSFLSHSSAQNIFKSRHRKPSDSKDSGSTGHHGSHMTSKNSNEHPANFFSSPHAASVDGVENVRACCGGKNPPSLGSWFVLII